MLKRGGNAADAAVAAAATLGVTEPYSAGIGGGGYFVFYDAETGKVSTIDGRETAPKKMPNDAFIDPATGKPYNFTPELVTSGVGVGTPGTPATWDRALRKCGTLSLADALEPAIKVATRGFVVDETFRQQTLDNEERFRAFRATKKLFLPKGDAPEVGSIFTNPDLAATYTDLAERGTRAFYRGDLAKLMVDVVRKPRTSKGTDLPVPQGYLSRSDLREYKVLGQSPTKVTYRGYDVYGMAPFVQRAGPRSARRSTSSSAPTSPARRRSRCCTTTSRPARWPSPTARSTSATRDSSTYPSRRCSATSTPPSGPAPSTRPRRR